jgi:hypothetical protein
MPEPILPLFTDPADHTPEERTRAVLAILTVGLFRLHRANVTPPLAPDAAGQNSRESLPNQLDVLGDQSVTVHAG